MTTFIKGLRKSYTFRLRKESPSFLDGVADSIDATGTLIAKYNCDETESLADANSLRDDWNAVGADLYSAIENHVPKFTR